MTWLSLAQSDQSSLLAKVLDVLQADLSLHWAYESICWFCRALSKMYCIYQIQRPLTKDKNFCFSSNLQLHIKWWMKTKRPHNSVVNKHNYLPSKLIKLDLYVISRCNLSQLQLGPHTISTC